ncbi:MAG TPA: SCO family protein [Candidatus Nitrosotalea sp.]|nr:SCO family protein [Candidatus Nitrosotalea sp.]
MKHTGAALWLCASLAAVVAACTNGGGLGTIGGGNTPSPPPNTGIGVAIPDGKIGVENDPTWGSIGGYTQAQTSQVLAYPPGTTVTVTNLSKVDSHTLNVIAASSGPPPQWPGSPSLSFSPTGNGVLSTNYASGILNPGGSVKVKLSNPGTYLIGCAIHYVSNTMRGIIVVENGATPGPTASPGPGGYAPPLHRSARIDRPAAARRSAPVAVPHLVDQRGRSFTLGSLRGRPFAVTFVSAHCSDACPLINAQFADAARRLAQVHLAARLVTITLDPEHDSPAAMRALAQRFDADPRYWLLAGGRVADVRAIMRSFGVVSIEGRDGYHDEHTTFVYVFNAAGSLTKTMLASTALGDELLDAVRDAGKVALR